MSAKDEGESDDVGGLPTEFRFDESPVRAVVQDDEPWFVAKDVCDILGIDNPSRPLAAWTTTRRVSLIHIRRLAFVKC